MVDAATNKVRANVGKEKESADSAFAAIANPDAAGSDPVADEYNAVIKEFVQRLPRPKIHQLNSQQQNKQKSKMN